MIALYEMAKTVKHMIEEETAKNTSLILDEVDQELKTLIKKGIDNLRSGINDRLMPVVGEVSDEKRFEIINTLILIILDYY